MPFPQPWPGKMGNQLRVVVLIPYALLDLPLADDETMKRKETVLILVCLIEIMMIASLIPIPPLPSIRLSIVDLQRHRIYHVVAALRERGMGSSFSPNREDGRERSHLGPHRDVHVDPERPEPPRRRGHDSVPGPSPSSYSKSDTVDDETESVPRNSSIDDNSLNLSTVFVWMGLSEDGTETFIFVAWATDHM